MAAFDTWAAFAEKRALWGAFGRRIRPDRVEEGSATGEWLRRQLGPRDRGEDGRRPWRNGDVEVEGEDFTLF